MATDLSTRVTARIAGVFVMLQVAAVAFAPVGTTERGKYVLAGAFAFGLALQLGQPRIELIAKIAAWCTLFFTLWLFASWPAIGAMLLAAKALFVIHCLRGVATRAGLIGTCVVGVALVVALWVTTFPPA